MSKIKQQNKYTNEDLVIMQKWDLQKKIQVSQTRLLEWYKHWDGMVYIAFSGGKDSTVLADLAARICKVENYKLTLWFSDTGLEYPEIREHVKFFGNWISEKYGIDVDTIIDYPKDKKTGKRITFKDVILSKGYPVVTKEISQVIEEARNYDPETGKYEYRIKQLNGERKDKNGNICNYNYKKWKFLLDAPFKISDKCCKEMKKKPAKLFEKTSGLKPVLGTMATESRLRKQQWIRNGCNSFDDGKVSSKPMSFWTEQDVLEYIVKFDIPYSSIYGKNRAK